MKCPFCGNLEDRVIDSRTGKDGDVIRRRRECLKCERRFTSYEKIEENLPLVIKKDSRREPFDRSKILTGLKKACEKRDISAETLDETVDEIQRKLLELEVKEVQSSWIGEEIMNTLKELDKVAYVRFASVYREFKDLNEFMEEMKSLFE
ncbi:transcriptional repressor NrdR [bacterium BMS3Bbin06]|nr:transcriptional repressor NrdR [bacterium BMS3Abin08]GBE34667.1 transcriptional repressor NrdR [bacterium BMS3Bbin06]HDO35598.1 transcriptional repressor NrdR [Nitrospirota bacterium]HDY70404.1 transcriptional repressor NrdR [Nitrospirota bacterium]